MAYITRGKCIRCFEDFDQAVSVGKAESSICGKCLRVDSEQKRKAYFDTLDSLTLSERIRKLEEWVYDYKPPVNIRDMLF